MKRMCEGDATKRETDSATSASRRERSPKIHLPPASSGTMTPPTKRCSTPKSLTPRASLRLPCGLGGYTRRVRSRAPAVRTTIYPSNATTKPGNEFATPSKARGLLTGPKIVGTQRQWLVTITTTMAPDVFLVASRNYFCEGKRLQINVMTSRAHPPATSD
jgi:hypothetical protein